MMRGFGLDDKPFWPHTAVSGAALDWCFVVLNPAWEEAIHAQVGWGFGKFSTLDHKLS